MPKAEEGNSTSRRGALQLLGFGATITIASLHHANEAHADTELLGKCDEFDYLTRAYWNVETGFPDEIACEAEMTRISERQKPLLGTITAYKPSTLAGHQARARSLFLMLSFEEADDEAAPQSWAETLYRAIVRDLAAGPV